jgi:hypothetical protein
VSVTTVQALKWAIYGSYGVGYTILLKLRHLCFGFTLQAALMKVLTVSQFITGYRTPFRYMALHLTRPRQLIWRPYSVVVSLVLLLMAWFMQRDDKKKYIYSNNNIMFTCLPVVSHLFICGLCNNDISSSNYIASDDKAV